MQIYKIKNTRLKLESRIFHLHKIFYSAKIFRKFISNEDFFLSHTDISKLYEKVESVEVKDRAYHLIKSLKECIAILDINVVSIRGKGYKLVFNSVSSNYNNN